MFRRCYVALDNVQRLGRHSIFKFNANRSIYSLSHQSTKNVADDKNPDITLRVLGQAIKEFFQRPGFSNWELDDIVFGLTVLCKYKSRTENVNPLPIQNITNLDNLLPKLQRFLRISTAAYASSVTSFAERSNITKEDILHYNPGKSFIPAYYLVINHIDKELIVAVRGTACLQDFCINLRNDHESFLNGHGHRGIVNAAQELLLNVYDPLNDLKQKYPNYKLRLTGHSLGAGTAALCTIALKHSYPSLSKNLHCYCFAPPACVSRDLAKDCIDYITGVIHGDDCIPRITERNLLQLQKEVSQFDWKNEFFRMTRQDFNDSAIGSFTKENYEKLVQKKRRVSKKARQRVQSFTESLLSHFEQEREQQEQEKRIRRLMNGIIKQSEIQLETIKVLESFSSKVKMLQQILNGIKKLEKQIYTLRNNKNPLKEDIKYSKEDDWMNLFLEKIYFVEYQIQELVKAIEIKKEFKEVKEEFKQVNNLQQKQLQISKTGELFDKLQSQLKMASFSLDFFTQSRYAQKWNDADLKKKIARMDIRSYVNRMLIKNKQPIKVTINEVIETKLKEQEEHKEEEISGKDQSMASPGSLLYVYQNKVHSNNLKDFNYKIGQISAEDLNSFVLSMNMISDHTCNAYDLALRRLSSSIQCKK